MAIDEDDRLVREFIAHGRIEDFETLVRRHQRSVFRIAMSVLGPGHEPAAEEIAQDVFLQVYRKLRGFEGRSRFSTWLYRIGYRRALDHVAARRRTVQVELTELPDMSRGPSDPLRDRAVRECLERLPDPQRSAIRLHYWMGDTVEEIATLLGTRPGTVKSWLFRARELLGHCLESKGVTL